MGEESEVNELEGKHSGRSSKGNRMRRRQREWKCKNYAIKIYPSCKEKEPKSVVHCGLLFIKTQWHTGRLAISLKCIGMVASSGGLEAYELVPGNVCVCVRCCFKFYISSPQPIKAH